MRKRCKLCGATKPTSAFYASQRGRRRPECKDCKRAYQRRYVKRKREVKR